MRQLCHHEALTERYADPERSLLIVQRCATCGGVWRRMPWASHQPGPRYYDDGEADMSDRGANPLDLTNTREIVAAELRRLAPSYNGGTGGMQGHLRRAFNAAADEIEHRASLTMRSVEVEATVETINQASPAFRHFADEALAMANEIEHPRTEAGTFAASGARTEVRRYVDPLARTDLTPSQQERQQRTGDPDPQCVRLQNGYPTNCYQARIDWCGRPHQSGPKPQLCIVCRRRDEAEFPLGEGQMRTPTHTLAGEPVERVVEPMTECLAVLDGMTCLERRADYASRGEIVHVVLCAVCRQQDRGQGAGDREPREPEPPTQPDAEIALERPTDRERAMHKATAVWDRAPGGPPRLGYTED